MDREGKLIPIWTKTGVIPPPKMPVSRVDCGLLMSLIARICQGAKDFNIAVSKIEDIIQKTIVGADTLQLRVAEDAQFVCVYILARSDGPPYGYTLYVPRAWFPEKQTD